MSYTSELQLPDYAEVCVFVRQVTDLFDYHIPPELAGQVQPGSLVIVPFSHQTVQGVVTRLLETPRVAVTRPISMLVDSQPVVSPQQLALARWMAEKYLNSLAACLDLMVPPGLSQSSDTEYSLNPGMPLEGEKLTGPQQRLITHLRENGPSRARQLDSAFKGMDWQKSMQSLQRRGLVISRPVLLPPATRPKMVRTVQLTASPQEVERQWDNLGRAGSQAEKRRRDLLKLLMKEPWPLSMVVVRAACQITPADLDRLVELNLISLGESEVWRDPLEQVASVPTGIPTLTGRQQQVWEQVQEVLRSEDTDRPPHILYGVTGSGKTEIYLRAVGEVLEQGKQAVVMVPEIALTPQTVRRFLSRFPGRVGLVHSQLSAGERFDTWRRARAGLLPVIVGPRSALFSPLWNPGLIIIDEFHEESYHQSDIEPRYSAVEAAMELARLTGALILLGSATPEVALMHRAVAAKWPVLNLPVRVLAHRQAVRQYEVHMGIAREVDDMGDTATSLPLPTVEVVDMRRELAAGNRSIFSQALQDAMRQVLERQQQGILFLNRRGSATYVFCRDCGYALTCPRCDLPVTYHTGSKALICHTCNYRRQMPTTCPSCGGPHIRQFGVGTEKVEQLAQELFPEARFLRWDAETTRQKGAHDLILSNFSRKGADFLIGTQMLAKGLDLPMVTLVGVILADVGLNLPDFRAGERTFQLLTQVAGRAGRSPLGGKVVLQTFQPEHYAIQAAASQDYREFYRREVARRRQIGYPPFSRLVRLEYRHKDAREAEAAARALAARLSRWIEDEGQRNVGIIGPVPCFFARQDGLYRWQIILRGQDPAAVVRGRSLPDWRIEVDPPSLL